MSKDQGRYHVLVVEDNPGDALLVEEYLHDEILTPQIHQVTTYKQAQKILREEEIRLDVLLLDLSLPDKEGADLVSALVRDTQGRGIPIIILTGYTAMDFARKSLAMGASDYILKDALNSTILYKSIVYNIERSRYILELRESEQRYEDLFQLSPQPLYVLDRQHLNFLDVNSAAVEVYGYSRAEFLQKELSDISPESELERFRQMREQASSNSYNSLGEFTHRRKDGSELVVDVRSRLISYQGTQAELFLATDITERYRYTQAIEKQNRQLQEIAQAESHMVRGPLARIMGMIQIIRLESSEDSEDANQNVNLNHLYQSAQELDEVIHSIVDRTKQISASPSSDAESDS